MGTSSSRTSTPTASPSTRSAVPAEDRLPVEVVLLAPDSVDGQAQLLDLLEMALEMETTPDAEKQPVKPDPRPAARTLQGREAVLVL